MMPTAVLKPLSASLPAGVVADRVSKKRILVIVLAANAVAAGTVSGLALAGAAPYWLLGLSALLIGASTAFFFPASTALVPMLVDEDQLMAVNGLEGATRPVVGQALAPAVAGAVIGAASPPAGGLLIALTLAAGAVLAARLPDVGARLPGSAGGDGAVLAALGLGGLVGSLVAGGTSAPRRFLPAMVTAWALACLPLALPAWTSSPWIIGAGLMLYGAGIGVGMVIWGTALQTHVPLVLAGVLAAAGQLRSEESAAA